MPARPLQTLQTVPLLWAPPRAGVAVRLPVQGAHGRLLPVAGHCVRPAAAPGHCGGQGGCGCWGSHRALCALPMRGKHVIASACAAHSALPRNIYTHIYIHTSPACRFALADGQQPPVPPRAAGRGAVGAGAALHAHPGGWCAGALRRATARALPPATPASAWHACEWAWGCKRASCMAGCTPNEAPCVAAWLPVCAGPARHGQDAHGEGHSELVARCGVPEVPRGLEAGGGARAAQAAGARVWCVPCKKPGGCAPCLV